MGYIATIFIVILAFVAFAQSKPQPKEEIPEPRLWFRGGITCELGVDCKEKNWQADIRAELKSLESWIEGLNAYGKANWRKEYPETSRQYDRLTRLNKQIPEEIPPPPEFLYKATDEVQLARMNQWIDQLNTFGKENWRTQYPQTAQIFVSQLVYKLGQNLESLSNRAILSPDEDVNNHPAHLQIQPTPFLNMNSKLVFIFGLLVAAVAVAQAMPTEEEFEKVCTPDGKICGFVSKEATGNEEFVKKCTPDGKTCGFVRKEEADNEEFVKKCTPDGKTCGFVRKDETENEEFVKKCTPDGKLCGFERKN
ncbi:unnamed protein product [Orchesella dallaii]|uniref:Uncharacterized protein n=1 Tax=Orchesella dallaii TaxID=48710 RepID=A0ABP1RPR3_9HEXA